MDVARQHGLIVIEDAAQAHGAKYKGRPVGSIGDMACFSFYPGKNLGAYGEGGAVTTSNDEYAQKVRMLRDWGQDRKYHHVLRGYNYRMESFQGAVLRVKLRHLDAWTNARRNVVSLYNKFLAGTRVETPSEMPWAHHVYHVYTLRTVDRDGMHAFLQAEGIQTGIHYPVPAHLQPAYSDLGYGRGAFPQSEEAANQVLSLPLYPELSPEAVAEVAAVIEKAVAQRVQTAVSR
jgi:dTDP-4-amino-4,6-dideoxygalactose transaminase